ncbi:hypothetical protein DdX_03286 [Ditylenchus destructor]|uniref:Uncharacterized protein n=1 Tax=Ditylenchus destructor TaxID=166010 RepID=A0AAD4NCT0_9BILA|nr:hypothetical protein DdX_03286 [Ditylenchus destructor]
MNTPRKWRNTSCFDSFIPGSGLLIISSAYKAKGTLRNRKELGRPKNKIFSLLVSQQVKRPKAVASKSTEKTKSGKGEVEGLL